MIHLENPSALLLVVPAGLAYWRWGHTTGARGLVRLCLLGILVIAAAGPSASAPERGSTLVLVIDRSASMPQRADLAKRAETERRPTDRLAVVGFGRAPNVERLPGGTRPAESARTPLDPDQSNLYAALAAALELIPAGERGRLLVESDGIIDDAPPDGLLTELRARGIPVDFHRQVRPTAGDVVLAGDSGPVQIEAGDAITFDLEIVHAASSEVKRGTLQVWRDDELVASPAVEIGVGRTPFSWQDRPEAAGVTRYRFELDVPGDPTPENNVWNSLVTVAGTPDVWVSNDTGGDTPLIEMLRGAGLTVHVSRASPNGVTLERLSGFQACVLEDVAADACGPVGLAEIARYVQRLGGGLVITGGRRSFGAGGYRFSPLEPLLPVELRPLPAGKRPPLALVVVDCSGSWDLVIDPFNPVAVPTRSPLQDALTALVRELAPTDAVGIVKSDVVLPVPLPLTSVGRKQDVSDAITAMSPFASREQRLGLFAVGWGMLQLATQPSRHLVVLVESQQFASLEAEAELARKLPIQNVSATLVMRGTAPDDVGRLSVLRPELRVMSGIESDKLAKALLHDLDLRTGGGFAEGESVLRLVDRSGERGVSVPSELLPRVVGVHEARLKDHAIATVVAADDWEVPRVAQWGYGLGRTSAVLFPIQPPKPAATGWNQLTELLVQQIRWTARRDGPQFALPVTVERSGRTAVVRVDLTQAAGGAEPDASSLELDVVAADGSKPSDVQPFRREASTLVARFVLERPQSYFPIIRFGDRPAIRCPPVALPRSPEFLRADSSTVGRAILTDLAERTKGREWSWGMPVYDEPLRAYRSLVAPLAWLAIVLLLLDVADRQHGWADAIEFARLRRRRRQSPASKPGEPSAESASDVFQRAKEQTRRRLQR